MNGRGAAFPDDVSITSGINIEDENERAILIHKVWKSGSTGRCSIGKRTRSVLLVTLTVLINVVGFLGMPVYSGTMDNIEGDAYALLFNINITMAVLEVIITMIAKLTMNRNITLKPNFTLKSLVMTGFLLMMNGVLIVYGSPPDRTPSYLQAILSTATIPFTVLCRYIVLRKGLSSARALCTCVVLIGLFITSEPDIWAIDSGDDGNVGHQSIATRILWPLCYALGFLSLAILNVWSEKEMKNGEVQSFNFVMWTQIFATLWTFLFFWVDFVPGFGMANSPGDFWDRLKRGTHCCYSLDSSCQNIVAKSWIYYFGYSLGLLFQFLLIEYSEGAVYAVIVQTLIAPCCTLFWTLFEYDQYTDYFHWYPHFDATTVFTLIGLAIMIPGVAMYNYYSEKESRTREKTPRRKSVSPS